MSANPTLDVQTHVELISSYLETYEHMQDLCMFVKILLKQQKLNEVHKGGVSSNTLQYMVVSFFKNYENHFGTKLEDVSLGTLLMDFLYLYGFIFNFETIALRPSTGTYERYTRTSCMCVWDPIHELNNVAAGSFNIQQVQELFRSSYNFLKQKLYCSRGSYFAGLVAPKIV